MAALPRIGLTLAGNGYRACLFHLGVLKRLDHYGLMPHVEVISGVSGGALSAAYYLTEMQRKLRANPYCPRAEASNEIIDQFRTIAATDLASAASTFRPFFRALNAIQHSDCRSALGAELQQTCFATRLTIADLPENRVQQDAEGRPHLTGSRLLIGAASVANGRRRVLSREPECGPDAQLNQSGLNTIPLGDAVAAACATPTQFPPVDLLGDQLIDGSLVDNLGIEALLDYFELSHPNDNRLPPEFRQATDHPQRKAPIVLLVVDGTASHSSTRSGPRQSIHALQAANRRRSLQLLSECAQSGLVSATGFLHLTMPATPEQRNALPDEFVPALASLRDGFDGFSQLEAELLMHHGFLVAKQEIARVLPGLRAARAQDPLPLPIQQRDELKKQRQRSEEAAKAERREQEHSAPQAHEKHRRRRRRHSKTPEDTTGFVSQPGRLVSSPSPKDPLPYALHLCNAEICSSPVVAACRRWIACYLRQGSHIGGRHLRRFLFPHSVLLSLTVALGLAVGVGLTRSEWFNDRSAPVLMADLSCAALKRIVPEHPPELIASQLTFLLSPAQLHRALTPSSGNNRSAGVLWSAIELVTSTALIGLAVYIALWLRWLLLRTGRIERYLLDNALMNLADQHASQPSSDRRSGGRSGMMYYPWRSR